MQSAIAAGCAVRVAPAANADASSTQNMDKAVGISDEVKVPLAELCKLGLCANQRIFGRLSSRLCTRVDGQELRKKLEYDVVKNQFMVTGVLTRSLYDEVHSLLASHCAVAEMRCSCAKFWPATYTRIHRAARSQMKSTRTPSTSGFKAQDCSSRTITAR